MKELLITIYVLSLQEEYDLFIPISLKMREAISLIQDSIVEMSDGNYEKKDQVYLYDENGNVINDNNPVKYSGLKNGSKVLLS